MMTAPRPWNRKRGRCVVCGLDSALRGPNRDTGGLLVPRWHLAGGEPCPGSSQPAKDIYPAGMGRRVHLEQNRNPKKLQNAVSRRSEARGELFRVLMGERCGSANRPKQAQCPDM